jgi:O-antigen/teichoic acid export membrane protein
VSRTRKAAVSVAFSYTQYALVVVCGLAIFPFTVRTVGAYDYGLWLASGEVVGYLALLDPGVFGLLPWLTAAADGANSPDRIKRYMVDGLAIGVAMGAALGTLAVLFWFAPRIGGGLSSASVEKIRVPVVLLIALTALGYPLRPFSAVLAGLQDVAFTGSVSIAQTLLTSLLTVGLLTAGYGLTGLALAVGLPPLLLALTAVVRLRLRCPHLIQRLEPPRFTGVWHLLVQGAGNWLSSTGTRLTMASSGIILAAVGHPEWATLYAATGKAAQLVQSACWFVPDSGLVGLAQLHGQGDSRGTTRTVACIMHLHVLISGGAMLALLAFNPVFVRLWLGPALYAGDSVNVLVAANLFVASIVHGAYTAVGTVRYRLSIGSLNVIAGVAYFALALGLAGARGLEGLLLASLISTVVFGLLPGAVLLGLVYGYGWRAVLSEALWPWLARSAPFLVGAGWLGATLCGGPLWQPVGAGALLGAVYLWWIRPMAGSVPWPLNARPWLVKLRLIPGSSAES